MLRNCFYKHLSLISKTTLSQYFRFPAQNPPRFPFRPPQPDQYHERNKFQMHNRQFDQNQDQMPPRPYNRHHDRPGIEEPAYSQDHDNRFHVNSMGDVDQRQQFPPPARHEPFGEPLPPWANRNRPRPFVRHDEIHDNQPNKLPVQDMAYSGHRPPASDHYEGRGPGIDNSNTFSRSVDDTVDIIRKKLQNRNDPQSQPMSRQEEETMREPPDTYHQRNMQQELTPRKKMFTPRQNLKTNCDQIKNKIVHQLFKMDKERIHKLMDNPNSSTKFEYAINSLITESQNSFNRHLRETAEKSLCGTTRNNIVPYDDVNDTIYEDTFMKQMQCILDPQDTILLEDIKPIVMAELNKVLQLNDFDNRQSVSTEEVDLHPTGRHELYDPYAEYAGDPQSDPQYYETHSSYNEANQYEGTYRRPENRAAESSVKAEMVREKENTFTSPPSLFERRAARKSCDYSSAKSASSESRRASVAENASSVDLAPYFDANAEHLSDDEDPFAELDKQYHVAVDHNFIAADDMIPETSHALRSPPQRDSRQRPPRRDSHKSDRNKRQIKQEIRCPTPDLPLEMLEVERKNILSALDSHIKSELLSADSIKDLGQTIPDKSIPPPKETALESPNIKKERPQENREREETIDKSDSSNMSSDKSSVNSNSRKRSTDQRPSHRKEKRKKSESSPTDANKHILNKNIIINLNDCAAKPPEKHNSNAKSVFNLYFSKDSNTTEKEEKKSESTTSNYTEKYVKRKESPQKPHKSKKPEEKEKKDDKKDKVVLTSPNHSTPASKETNTNPDQGTSKSDCKIKLKPIDMFTEQPKKVPSHQAHRNTATPVKTPTHEEKKIPVITIKPLLKSISKQVTRKHVATQIFRKMFTKVTQTDKKLLANSKLVTKCVQTDPVSFEGNKKKSTDAFERMKEIDMEIQILLQEKFKLYNSLEAKEVTSSIQNLGMTVLNVEDKDAVTADSIIDEFTNIPEDELAEIALETVADDDIDFEPKSLKKTKPGKPKQKGRNRSQSPTTPTTKRLKKARTPNISLLEQIIKDDRPLEDIISLDDLETSPVKPRSKRIRNPTPKTYKPKKTLQKQRVVTPPNQQKARAVKPDCQPDIKPCSIVLTRTDVSKYLKPKQKEAAVIEIQDDTISESTKHDAKPTSAEPIQEVGEAKSPMVTEEIIEESVANDFHFQVDMLDVSEDIVIGGEEKIDDKESESISVPITEEVVLDNSQSGEDVGMETAEVQTGGCKMYDFSADEDLKHDAVGVSGNGDAVLAIEVRNAISNLLGLF